MDHGGESSSQDNNPTNTSTSQDAEDNTHGKRKRKSNFSHEEMEILITEVTKHQHQLFITSKLPLWRKEAIWQNIMEKVNSVGQAKRTVNDCKKRWHDSKRRTKEKLASNLKAACVTGGGSPAPQEQLDALEEMVATVIPHELVSGILGQDSACHEQPQYQQGKSQ